jgi:hypothetical protein
MSRTTTLKRFGQLTLVALVMVLAAGPPARAGTEMASQCFYMSPYTFSIRIVRIASDQTPGMQAVFVQFRIANSFQMLGTGIRSNSLTPPQKDILVSFVDPGGRAYRLTALFDPATGSGPWTFYDNDGSAFYTGTLLKVPCDTVPGVAEAGEAGPDGPGLPQ